MKKHVKEKGSKGSSGRSAVPEPQLPDLVSAMMKMVERLEILERKMDIVLGRVSNLNQHPQQRERADHGPAHAHTDGRRERIMYKAVCADCSKSCEVPFKPTGERAVYCKECFTIRKAGHVPQDPDRRSPLGSSQKKAAYVPSALSPQGIPTLYGNVTAIKNPRQKSARKNAAKPKKKKK